MRGLVGLAFMAAGGLLKQFRGLKLRRPTPQQVDDFAEPMGGIVGRHVPMESLGPDLYALIEAGSAVGNYALDGPVVVKLTVVAYAEDGVEPEPDRLNTAQPDDGFDNWLSRRKVSKTATTESTEPVVTYMS